MKGYIFYFMLGYYLNIKKKIGLYYRISIYSAGFIGFVFTTIFSYHFSIIKNQKLLFFTAFNLNILAYAFSIFVFFRLNFNNINFYLITILKRISNYTFGIYLIHPLIINKLSKISNDFSYFTLLIFKIPLMSTNVFFLSLIICIIIKFIPFIGKYLI